MRRYVTLLLAVSCCLLVLSAVALGQSGRKQKKADPQPPVQGVNQPEARTVPEPEVAPDKPKEKEPAHSMLISSYISDIGISSFFPDTARRACLQEVRNLLRVVELQEARDQHRSDAIKAAKNDDRTYVVWMEFELDRMGTSRYGFELRYTIFEPKTAKIVGSGYGYPVQPNGPMGLPPVGSSQADVYADWAGRDVARQVVKRLGWVP